MKQTLFERHPKVTLFILASLLLVAGFFIMNKVANKLFGLGNVVIYEANPIYGYRPIPQQQVTRRANTHIVINNLGLRAEQEWDINDFSHKVLFLGDSVTYGGSYISNERLFSTLVGNYFPTFMTGNAGVNGWGVNNVHAFIKEMHFLPAQVYVSVFPEGDFYRGLNRIGGQPFWSRKPAFALEEVFQYLIYELQLRKAPIFNINLASKKEKELIVDIAVRNLKELDMFLKENHRDHIIYISPSRYELLGVIKQDEIIKDTLLKYGLKAVYIKDRLDRLSSQDIEQYFHDDIHLSEMGHQKWANIISQDLKDILTHREKESLFVQNNSASRTS